MNRLETIQNLKTQSFDILVIGGGATGSGIALDAATRGLKVALVERGDFASGTSSKSTKLIHGGVRYLELAVKQLDMGQIHLVKEALFERSLLLKLAPHMTRKLAIFTPLYQWTQIPYYMAGLKAYDLLAGKANLEKSRWVSSDEAQKRFPVLKSKGLKGGILYYDGQFDDARMNVSIALTAIEKGAFVANYVKVENLLKENEKLCGAKVTDVLGNETFEIKAKTIINAAGPYVDSIRKMAQSDVLPMLTVSSGVHLIIDRKFCPPDTGLLTPKTEDGRVLFMLPWLGATLVGTTDCPAEVRESPQPTQEEIDYLLRYINQSFEVKVGEHEILSSWAGLRPLVSNANFTNTASLSRDHVIEKSVSGLITITGGKWTTYRKMALDAVNEAVQSEKMEAGPSQTEKTFLVGGEKFQPTLPQELEKSFGLPPEVCRHLSRAYGDRAIRVAEIAQKGFREKLSPHHPYIEAEVIYTTRHEMAQTAIDVLARRLRLFFLDQTAAKKALPRVCQLMAQELDWDEAHTQQEEKRTF